MALKKFAVITITFLVLASTVVRAATPAESRGPTMTRKAVKNMIYEIEKYRWNTPYNRVERQFIITHLLTTNKFARRLAIKIAADLASPNNEAVDTQAIIERALKTPQKAATQCATVLSSDDESAKNDNFSS